MAIEIINKTDRTFYLAGDQVLKANSKISVDDKEAKYLLDLYPGELEKGEKSKESAAEKAARVQAEKDAEEAARVQALIDSATDLKENEDGSITYFGTKDGETVELITVPAQA